MSPVPTVGADPRWRASLRSLFDAASDHLRSRAALDGGAWALVRAAADSYLPAAPLAQVCARRPDTPSQGGFHG